MKIRSILTGGLCTGALSVLLPGAMAQGLVFSELMVHPVDDPAGPVDGDQFEYLELHNPGPGSMDLEGAYFSKGIDYTFTNSTVLVPGAYLVLAKDRAAFSARYPAVSVLAPGAYTGSLNNGGERVTLKSAAGGTLFSVSYGTGGDWPAAVDGRGASLRLRDPDGDPDEAANWCADSRFNGSPGESGQCAVRDVVVNEVLTHSDPPYEDAIELLNVSTGSVSVLGWYLSDAADTPAKYRITNSAALPPGGFFVLYEYQFNTNAYFDTNNIPFALSSAYGDEVFLTAAEAPGQLTDMADQVAFDAARNGVAFGRHLDGTGLLVPVNTPTFGVNNPGSLAAFRSGTGAPNADPAFGPVVIAEIMYHPVNDNPDLEYVELLNTSATTVPLFDPAAPSNRWQLAEAVDFVIPPGINAAPGERLLLTGSTNEAAFRAAYALDPGIRVFGPWDGKLNNAGESIRLQQPDPAQPDGFVPYVHVDRVDYGDKPPWPIAPDGNGPSLERLSGDVYGMDPAHWFAGPPGGTPGTAPAAGFVDPIIFPNPPLPNQSFVVTVSVVAETLPTQVVWRAETAAGVAADLVMRDDGGGGDAVAGDQVYTVTVPGQAGGTRVYYRFMAYGADGSVLADPPSTVEYLPSDSATFTLCNDGLETLIEPGREWRSYETTGPFTHDTCFYFFLNGPGEVLVDDVEIRDASSLNHVRDSGFNEPLEDTDWRFNGNHGDSFLDQDPEDDGNQVLHLVARGPGLGTVDGISQYIFPDMPIGETGRLRFRARLVSENVDLWSWVDIGTVPPDPVINEIMYHPSGTNELEHEYLELYNPATVEADVSGWRLRGVSMTLPENTVIGAGGYLVVGADADALTLQYGITNRLGGWLGQLRNSGETLRLVDDFGRQADLVDYSDREPWPVPADGYGPSLERLHEGLTGTSSVSWAASRAVTNWVRAAWTGSVHDANNGMSLFLDYEGMVWVDDVSVVETGGGPNQLTNGNFENGLTGWTTWNNHDRSRVVSGEGRGGSAALALFGTQSRFILSNSSDPLLEAYGDAASNAVISAEANTRNSKTYVVSWWARREGLGASVVSVLDGTSHTVGFASCGTPGVPNSRNWTGTPVGLVSVMPDRSPCTINTPNVIRARVSDPALTATVHLDYRVVSSNDYRFTEAAYTTLSMRDDGLAPDTAAGDGQFAAEIPGVANNQSVVRYRARIIGLDGFVQQRPDPDDLSNDYAYWVESTPPQARIPNWHLLVDGNPIRYPVNRKAIVISPDGEVYTDVEVRHRGRPTGQQERTGLAVRMHRARPLDTWFADNQGGINFRSRGNDNAYYYRRVVNEALGYHLQDLLGFAVPRTRHVCTWINGSPTVTLELEAPEQAFLEDNGMDSDDYLSRAGYTGRRIVAGNPGLDNFNDVKSRLINISSTNRLEVLRSDLDAESFEYSLALLALTANGDQQLYWNMFQHRRAEDGRWQQYPWDVDMSFTTNNSSAPYLVELHPYYQTPDHGSIWDDQEWSPSANAFFYPETGPGSETTLPWRYRHQKILWRHIHTVYTTNALNPYLDAMVTELAPVYDQVYNRNLLDQTVAEIKRFIDDRRDFLAQGTWSDRDAAIWSAGGYDPSGIVVNEIMVDPLAGTEYVELHNPGTEAIDLSRWTLQVANERYVFPFGTLLGPTSYLAVADSQAVLTNRFMELADAESLVQRVDGLPLWDDSLVWTTAVDFATRVAEVPGLTLPNTGATVELTDLLGNVIDHVTYTNSSWTVTPDTALELVDAVLDNNDPAAWRLSTVEGTPARINSAALDRDEDGMTDRFEEPVVAASGGSFTNVNQVLPGDDFDEDGLTNMEEFMMGTHPVVPDAAEVSLDIHREAGRQIVTVHTRPADGPNYTLYLDRLYSLETGPALDLPAWTAVSNYTARVGSGPDLVFTNTLPDPNHAFRYRAELQGIRP